MGNRYIDLPLPAGNGAGPAVDASALGGERSVQVTGEFPGSIISIEVSQTGSLWAPLSAFQTRGPRRSFTAPAAFMRAFVKGRAAVAPFSANVDVSSSDDGVKTVSVPVSPGVGAGPSVDVSALGSVFLAVSPPVPVGSVYFLEASLDGTSWQTVRTFTKQVSEAKGFVFTAQFLRIRTAGRPAPAGAVPFEVAAANDPGSTPASGDVAYLPGSWAQMDVAANQVDQALAAEESQLFDTIPVNRPLSVVGIRTRLTEAITNGTLTVTATLNGAATGVSLVHTAASNPLGGGSLFPTGLVSASPGDEVGVRITTDAAFAPNTTDLAVWLEEGPA